MSDISVSGPWTWARAAGFLEDAVIPARISVVSPSGWPVIASLWFIADDKSLWLATKCDSAIAKLLQKNNKCAFEVAYDAPPYRGLRGQANATLHPEQGVRVLQRLIDKYLESRETKLAKWLLNNATEEVAIRLTFVKCQSWDYSDRMNS